MRVILSWLPKPLPEITAGSWGAFLDDAGASSLLTLALSICVIVFLYRMSAARRTVLSVDDLFTPYTPLRWIFLSLAAAALNAGACGWFYWDVIQAVGADGAAVSTHDGALGTALVCALLVLVFSAGLSYLAIRSLKSLTPGRFRYRPAHPLAVRAR